MAKMNFAFGRKKEKFPNEADALQDVLTKQNTTADKLTANHKDKMWYWEQVTTSQTNETKSEVLELEKAEYEKKAAIKEAMNFFNTFEGNIKVQDNETQWLLSKVRG